MTRELLPRRRGSITFTFEHAFAGGGHHEYTACVGFYDDGRPGELFLETGKTGTAIDAWARDSAILASLALQYGVPIKTMRAALTRNADSTASGVIGTLLDVLAGHSPDDPEKIGEPVPEPVQSGGGANETMETA